MVQRGAFPEYSEYAYQQPGPGWLPPPFDPASQIPFYGGGPVTLPMFSTNGGFSSTPPVGGVDYGPPPMGGLNGYGAIPLPITPGAIVPSASSVAIPGWLIAMGAAGLGWLWGQITGGGEIPGIAPGAPAPGGGGGGVLPPLVGPGVKEPHQSTVVKQWSTKVYDNQLGYIKMEFYLLTDGRIMMYHGGRKYYKIWRPKKHIVISSNPRLKTLAKLDRVYKRTQKMVRKYAPKTRVTSTQAPSRFLSAAEKKLLKAGS